MKKNTVFTAHENSFTSPYVILLIALLMGLFMSLGLAACSQPTEQKGGQDGAAKLASSSANAGADQVLALAPPPSAQPADHKGRWEEGDHTAALCYECHGPNSSEKDTPKLPESHITKDDKGQLIVKPERAYCIICHPLAME